MILMISKPKMINEVVSKFVITTLPTISGGADYESLNDMIQELYENSATLPTTLYVGKHVHIGLIMK